MASISTLVDRVKIFVLSSGTGPFQLGSAVPAFRGIEALVDGSTYSYAVEDNSNYEAGTAAYVASSGTMVRSPIISSNGGAAVSFPANVQLVFTALAQDIVATGASFPIVQTTGNATDKVMSQKAVTDRLTGLNPSGLISSSGTILKPSGRYGVQTTAGAFTVTLPSITSSLGTGPIEIYDVSYAADTNNITVNAAGSDTISSFGISGSSQTLNIAGISVKLFPTPSGWSMIV